MNGSSSSQLPVLLNIVFFLLLLIVAGLIYFIARAALIKLARSRGKTAEPFFIRLLLPVILLILTAGLKLKIIKSALRYDQKFALSIDAALIFFAAFFIIRLFDAAIWGWFGRHRRPFPLPRVLHGLILAVIYLAILFAVLNGILGFNITPFLATSAILTMILGLALQGVLSNILAGMSLHFTKSFSRGDWIRVGNFEGVVVDTSWRETRILDRYSNIVVIPNNIVASETITNFSLPDKKSAVTLPVKASFQAPPASVLKCLLDAAREVPEVLTTPTPQAYILDYEDWGVSYLLKFWITDFGRREPIRGEVARQVWSKFRRQNIEVPVVVGQKVEDVLRAVREKDVALNVEREAQRNFQDLLNSSFLRYTEGEKAGEMIISEADIRELASLVRRGKYSQGEILFKQGEKGQSCYVVARGVIRGEIAYEEKEKKYLQEFRVSAGGIFGEMSLLTGMPRTATGIIEEDSELLEIGSEEFAVLLSRNAQLAEIVAEIASARNLKNAEFLRKIKELSEKEIAASCDKKSIVEYLKKFIRLMKRPERA
jgi:small-conductance mechanosensitive channel/CRP-like cAMP-binding protein